MKDLRLDHASARRQYGPSSARSFARSKSRRLGKGARGADLTFATLPAARSATRTSNPSSISINKLASGPLTPTFANVSPRMGCECCRITRVGSAFNIRGKLILQAFSQAAYPPSRWQDLCQEAVHSWAAHRCRTKEALCPMNLFPASRRSNQTRHPTSTCAIRATFASP
jgi:hypothetical protein